MELNVTHHENKSLNIFHTVCIITVYLNSFGGIMKDKELIQKLGGVKAVSNSLGYNYTTVHNWLTRGISKDAKIAYPEIFMPKNLDEVKHVSEYNLFAPEEA